MDKRLSASGAPLTPTSGLFLKGMGRGWKGRGGKWKGKGDEDGPAMQLVRRCMAVSQLYAFLTMMLSNGWAWSADDKKTL